LCNPTGIGLAPALPFSMHFEPDQLYHVYNRGNGKQRIFFNKGNYLYLLKKIREEWSPYADVLAFCLMPNHFHFIIRVKPAGCIYVVIKDRLTHMQFLSKAIGKTLSSYARAINMEQNRSGNLFQRKTKAKNMSECDESYLLNCLHYIHSNPVAAGMVHHEKNWPFSSYLDYCGLRKGTLCNRELFFEVSGISEEEFGQSFAVKQENFAGFF
jgi:putative transposase